MASAREECLALDPAAAWDPPGTAEVTRVSWSTSFDR
jgi:hypothetical protein